MLKTIPTNRVVQGMFIQELKGSWVDHPFWKTKFLLSDADDLRKLLQSGVLEVVIDTAKGKDLVQESPVVEQVAAIEMTDSFPDAKQPEPVIRLSVTEERAAAKKAIDASKKAVASMFSDIRMGKAISAEAAMPLVEDIASSVSRNESALISLVRLKTKDDYTYMHSVAVCALMVALGKQLKLSEAEIKQAGLAGLLHDVGKAMIPDEVLNKPGALTDSEFDLVKTHPAEGHKLLIQGGVTDEVALDVCLRHHEKIDGSGYPSNLMDAQISLFAKMGAVCDVYDAITSNRPYKKGWEPGVSLQRMAQWKNHFDQAVFKAFVKSVGIYPVGSMVKLKSGRLAVVMDLGGKSLLTPIVKVFFSTKSKTRIPVEVIDLSHNGVNDEIIGHDDPVLWGIEDVSSLWIQS